MSLQPQFTLARDGSSIAYRVHGVPAEDAPAVVFTNGFATSDFYWIHVLGHLMGRARMATWDLKGHGRSGPAHDLSACTIPDSVDDLRRVMDAAGVETATLVGFSLGCQIAFEAWRQIPDRIDALVPILGTYGRPFDYVVHPRFGRLIHRVTSRLGPDWGPIIVDLMRLSMRSPLTHPLNQAFGMIDRKVTREDMTPFYEHFDDIDGETWVAMALAAQEHSAGDLLETIDVPTLIIAGGRDLLTPQHLSLEMRDRIPDAHLEMLPRATHAGLFEYPAEICQAVDEFLTSRGLILRAEEASRISRRS